MLPSPAYYNYSMCLLLSTPAQVLVFCNLFTLQSHSAEIIDLLLRLMENSQMEVGCMC